MGTIVELIKGSEEKKVLWQWDSGRELKIIPEETTTVDKVEFSNVFLDEALAVEPRVGEGKGDIVVGIPNILLQDVVPVEVYVKMRLPNGECTTHRKIMEIEPRKKPSNYVYTEIEIKNYDALEKRIEALEMQGGISFEIEGIVTLQEFCFTDDEKGNVTIVLPELPITDDNKGNITITSSQLAITEDGNGNVAIMF